MDILNDARRLNVNKFDSLKSNKALFTLAPTLLALIGLQVSACQSLDAGRRRVDTQGDICINSIDVIIPNTESIQLNIFKEKLGKKDSEFDKNKTLEMIKSTMAAEILKEYGGCRSSRSVNKGVLTIIGFKRETISGKNAILFKFSFNVIEENSGKTMFKFDGNFRIPIQRAPAIILSKP